MGNSTLDSLYIYILVLVKVTVDASRKASYYKLHILHFTLHASPYARGLSLCCYNYTYRIPHVSFSSPNHHALPPLQPYQPVIILAHSLPAT